ncbi:MAG: suppressor of fused domain protein [Zoogloeaceae bacterium]|nr:suppressor of fused domain protein [Zoogloeaceae bacterium]
MMTDITQPDITQLMQAICAEKSWADLNRAFSSLYGEPYNQMANMPGSFLTGYSIFNGPDHRHIVTYGLAQRHRFHGRAYELTLKLPMKSPFMWTFDVLSAAAHHAWSFCGDVLPQFFDYGTSLKENTNSKLTALLFLPDQCLSEAQIPAGRLHFLQAVGITSAEYQALAGSKVDLPELTARLRVDNPLLLTRLKRKESYA